MAALLACAETKNRQECLPPGLVEAGTGRMAAGFNATAVQIQQKPPQLQLTLTHNTRYAKLAAALSTLED
mgnify:CR=1 FL=1